MKIGRDIYNLIRLKDAVATVNIDSDSDCSEEDEMNDTAVEINEHEMTEEKQENEEPRGETNDEEEVRNGTENVTASRIVEEDENESMMKKTLVADDLAAND